MILGHLTVDSLVFSFLVDIMEIPQHLQGRKMRTCIVDYSFRAVLDQVLEQLQCLGEYPVSIPLEND